MTKLRSFEDETALQDLYYEKVLKEFTELLATCFAAVERGDNKEVDLEREVEGRDTVRITIRRKPFRYEGS